ncbi:hypothetical protein [Mesobacillus foraminis]|uniref:hypothetical protein n=1 Tax=Mesobacillus foraminis TaxID=279826 RepID=UPI0010507FDA|nr:hypothetical protein [Mesobacillus foraminis]
MKTPAGSVGQVDPAGAAATRRVTARPAESETPGMEVNSPVLQPDKIKKDCDKLDFHRESVYSLSWRMDASFYF